MRFDDDLLLVSEVSSYPGSHGDSCANTARFQILTNGPTAHVLNKFFVNEGQVRHPSLYGYVSDKGESWSYDDFSVDQWIPLFIATMLYEPILAKRMLVKLVENKWRVGDGTLINVMFISIFARAARKSSWFKDLPILIHALGTLIPWRWSDADKRIESSEGSSADYLNWFLSVMYAHRTKSNTLSIKLSKLIITETKLLAKIKDYCRIEPDGEWLVALYETSIKEVYRT